MGMQEVRIHEDEGKSDSYAKLIFDQTIVDVFDDATEPLQAFLRILENVGEDSGIPHEGHPVLCAKVMEALLDHQRRVITQAVECVDGQVGRVILNAHDYCQENREEGIAGQYCRARITKQK